MSNKLILPDDELIIPCDAGEVSDGFHTFNELYDHRCVLFLAFLTLANNGWYSEKHSDGSVWDGWFIAGIELTEGEQITYHLPNKYLKTASQRLRYLECAPEWDGHTSCEVLERLTNWMNSGSNLLPKH